MSSCRRGGHCNCLQYKGECINLSYTQLPEPSDFESELIRRCAIAIDIGADLGDVVQLCLDAGQTTSHAQLTYTAALLLSQGRRTP